MKKKKLMMFVMAAVFAAAFVPCAHAAESAQLGLQVTFAVDQDLQHIKELKDHVYELENISSKIFDFIYVDRNQDGKVDYKDLDINGDGVINDEDVRLLKNAVEDLAHISDLKLEDVKNQLKEIAERRPDLKPQIEAVLDHAQQLQGRIHDLIEKLKSLMVQPVISIELNESDWKLDGVKLGEKRSNQDTTGAPMHAVKNTGTVPVLVAIGYGPQVYTDVIGQIRPGTEPGLDTFATYAASIHDGEEMGGIIPPSQNRKLLHLAKEEAYTFILVYYSPTKLSSNAKGMSTTYELRAYPALIVDPPIVIIN